MDEIQQRELREWAGALSTDGNAERRAVGRAIEMLLDRVDELQLELARRPPAPPPVFDHDDDRDPRVPERDVGEDTAPLRLSDRIRAASGRLHHRGD